MRRLFLFLFAAILGISQVWGKISLRVYLDGSSSATSIGVNSVTGFYYTAEGAITGSTSPITLSLGTLTKYEYSSSVQAKRIYCVTVNIDKDNYEFVSWTIGSYTKKNSLSDLAAEYAGSNVCYYLDGDKFYFTTGKNTADISYSYVGFNIKTKTTGSDDDDDDDTTPKYVDLGLPSGTLWATCNLGAASETEAGNYYAFAETSTKAKYDETTDTWDPYSNKVIRMDMTGSNYEDGKGHIHLWDDVNAACSLGEGWGMPTYAELQELIDNCKVERVSGESGGYRLTSKISGYTDKSIFIPFSGHMSGTSKMSATGYNAVAKFWTRTRGTNGVLYGYSFNDGLVSQGNTYEGLPIRPVYVPSGTKVKATFVMDDNSAYTTKQVDKYTEQPSVTAPTKSSTETYYYTFDKWTPALSKISVPPTYNASFTANPIDFTITYELDGGSVASANPVKYNVVSNAITLNNPTKPGYDFAGWTGTGLDGAQMTVVIPKGSKGARSYTATWTEVTALTLVDDKNAGDSWYTWLGGCVGEDKILDVTYNRTFPAGTADAPSWSAFSLPFDYPIEDDPRFNQSVLSLKEANYDKETGVLTLYFLYQATYLNANKPYIFYNKGAELENPVFEDVTIVEPAKVTDEYVDCAPQGKVYFKNTIAKIDLPDDENIAFLYDNKLYYSGSGNTMRAFRGYFEMDGVVNAGSAAPRRIVMMVDEATALTSEMEVTSINTKKVIEGGVLYIERNGVRYDAQGAEVK